jgi:hypothetical protein
MHWSSCAGMSFVCDGSAEGGLRDRDGAGAAVTPGLKGAVALIFGCFVRAGGKENAERLKS